MSVLMIDIGGSNVKLMVSGHDEMRKLPSGKTLRPDEMVAGVKTATRDWTFDKITVGVPALIENGQLVREPLNLGGGWLGFDMAGALERPVRMINDAALHALASYRGGRMLFVGFGTSIGAALVADDMLVSVELGLIPFTKRHTFQTRLTKEARRRYGHKRWEENVLAAVTLLQDVFWPRDTVIGGGNAKHLTALPPGTRRSSNQDGIVGALRVWEGADLLAVSVGTTWRISREGAAGRPWPASVPPSGHACPA